jgi:hypothetical protein
VGEDEVTTALRLLERVVLAYPWVFDLLMADALYATSAFFNFLQIRKKPHHHLLGEAHILRNACACTSPTFTHSFAESLSPLVPTF